MAVGPAVSIEASGQPGQNATQPDSTGGALDQGRHLLAFGVPAMLKPVPRRPAAPSLALVPDTALDWLDTEGVSVRAVSCRGHMKRYEGDLRQDAFALGEHEGYLWVAVADGVGSAQRSHVGAALATALATSGLCNELAAQAATLLPSGEPTFVRLSSVASALHSEAVRNGLPARDLSTTLLIAAIPAAAARALGDGHAGGIDVALWQVGDSPFARLQGMDLTILGPTEESDGPLANSAVSALPEEPVAHAWVEHFEPGETLALMTDGVGNIAVVNADYRAALNSLWAGGPPTPAALLEVVDATVKSFDDDRTFVGVHFGARTSRWSG